ncbi:glycosyltransferase family 2 protein [Thermococcus gammatolerans]|uniref:Glycosyltransferase, putative n=1 Tax=Thermococcus gammatolerans (strain DSM 15229 / JCM 11827 / EJ3) TaxID=593117 RepID=C5A4C9_THEGJ|nr:glycosyltransferase family 2 protein [Thermococcus gammatolerans]ACS33091.1 Glycosyltransferase, putative [Thermococcus gammatolerans EJ3]
MYDKIVAYFGKFLNSLDCILQSHEKEFWRDYTLEKHNQLNYSKLEYSLFLTIGILGSLILNSLSGNHTDSLSTLDKILVNAKYIWLAYSPIAALSSYGLLRYNAKDDFQLERKVQSEDYKVTFQITTRGFNKDAVRRGVKSVAYWAPKYLRDYEIWVVTEDDVDKSFFDKLKEIDDNVRIIYVPRDYKTKNNTKYKARALNYALDVRREEGYISDKTWIYLMDEESIVGEDTILGIIDFIENEAKKGKLIGQGLIVYSNFWGKNLLTSLEDSLRAGDDITRYKIQARYGKVIVGIHGSHLLYRSDLEDIIGWDFGEVRAEDAYFGLLINKYFNKAWGWLKGKLYEQSPYSIKDFLKQRRRWLWGKLDILLKNKTVGVKYKLIQAIHLISWLSSLPSIIITYINIAYPTPVHHKITSVAFGYSIATLSYLYWEGSKLNLEPSNASSRLKRVLNILAIPIIAPLEGLSAWYGLLTYRESKKKGFEVIRK